MLVYYLLSQIPIRLVLDYDLNASFFDEYYSRVTKSFKVNRPRVFTTVTLRSAERLKIEIPNSKLVQIYIFCIYILILYNIHILFRGKRKYIVYSKTIRVI